ncbi:MAG: ZIP family metal transporter, partial [Flavobacterium sp.]
MINSIYILPLLSVILGYVIAIFFRPKSKKNLKLLLAFSGAFLLSLTVMHLLPEVYEADLHHEAEHHHHHSSAIGIYI